MDAQSDAAVGGILCEHFRSLLIRFSEGIGLNEAGSVRKGDCADARKRNASDLLHG
jgi:hypothetical protein